MESEFVEPILNIIEPPHPYIRAIINGLIATVILWGFWTPFILLIAKGLVNAQLKGAICGIFKDIASQSSAKDNYNKILYNLLQELASSGSISIEQLKILESLLSITGNSDTPAKHIIDNDPKNMDLINLPLSLLFLFVSIIIILACMLGVYQLSYNYNIPLSSFFSLNLTMFFIIIIIEILFFSFVAMRYIPFDINKILSNLKDDCFSYLNSISGPNSVPCTIDNFVQQNDYFIGDWLDSYVNMDDAKAGCLQDPKCVGVTNNSSFGGIHTTWSRTKYSNPTDNNGATSWILKGCRE